MNNYRIQCNVCKKRFALKSIRIHPDCDIDQQANYILACEKCSKKPLPFCEIMWTCDGIVSRTPDISPDQTEAVFQAKIVCARCHKLLCLECGMDTTPNLCTECCGVFNYCI